MAAAGELRAGPAAVTQAVASRAGSGRGFRRESMTYTGLLGESCLKQAMASICNDRGAGQGRAQRAGSAGRRSLDQRRDRCLNGGWR